jgi:hypothetical protein
MYLPSIAKLEDTTGMYGSITTYMAIVVSDQSHTATIVNLVPAMTGDYWLVCYVASFLGMLDGTLRHTL